MQLTPIASNMTEVETSEARILFSYRTPVAAYVFGAVSYTHLTLPTIYSV